MSIFHILHKILIIIALNSLVLINWSSFSLSLYLIFSLIFHIDLHHFSINLEIIFIIRIVIIFTYSWINTFVSWLGMHHICFILFLLLSYTLLLLYLLVLLVLVILWLVFLLDLVKRVVMMPYKLTYLVDVGSMPYLF